MTRLQARQEKEALQRSADEANGSNLSSSSFAPGSSSLWSNRDNGKNTSLMRPGNERSLDYLSNTMDSETVTSYEDGILLKGGAKDLGTTSTEDDRMIAHELGLAPHSPPGFFDSSQDVSQVADPIAALIETTPSRQQKSHLEVVVPGATRSTGSATPARLDFVDSPAHPVTPVEKAKEKAKAGMAARKSSVAPSESSTSFDVSELATPSTRPRRSAAKPKDYSAPWNADGTEITPLTSKAKSSSAKESRKSSGKATRSSKGEEVIVIDDEEDGEGEDEVQQVAKPSEQSLNAQAEDDAASEHAGSITMVDPAPDDEDDEEEVVTSRKKAKARKSTASEGTSENESDDEVKNPRRNNKGRQGNARLQDSDDEEEPSKELPDDAINSIGGGKAAIEVVVETPVSKSRSSKKAKGKQASAEKKAGEEVDPEAAPVEEEEKDTAQQSKTKVLADASAAVNAGRRGGKAKEAKSVSSSSSSTSARSVIIDTAKRFWGKPLSSLLGANQYRSPGLAKRKIAPLLAIRNEPPPKRAAIPIPKSKQKNKDEDLDSDEEESRANETPEQRMARYIREQDEGD